MVTFHTMYNAYSLDQIDVQVLDTCGACINDCYQWHTCVGWCGLVKECGLVNGCGLVKECGHNGRFWGGECPWRISKGEKGGKRLGETRNNVWPSHPLHYKFQQQSCAFSCSTMYWVWIHPLSPQVQYTSVPAQPHPFQPHQGIASPATLTVLPIHSQLPLVPPGHTPFTLVPPTPVAAYLVFRVSAYLIYCTYPYILLYIQCTYT